MGRENKGMMEPATSFTLYRADLVRERGKVVTRTREGRHGGRGGTAVHSGFKAVLRHFD